MARPPDADSAETYDRIVEAALHELRGAQPKTSVSMRRIAERAGVSLGTVQYYFEDKDALLEACLDGYYARLGALGARLFAETAARPEAPLEETIRTVMRALFRFVREERALLELRLITNALRGELHPARQPEFMGDVIGKAAAALAPRVGRSEVDLRLSIQSLAYTAVRLALLSAGERTALVGSDDDAADRIIEDYAVEAACRLVLAPER